MKTILKYSHLFSMIIAFCMALLIGWKFALLNPFLMAMTAIFVMQTPVGNVLYQSMLRMIVVILLVILVALIATIPIFYNGMHDVIIGASIGIIANILILPRHAAREFRLLMIPVITACENYFFNMNTELLGNSNNLSSLQQEFETQLLRLPDWVYARGFDLGFLKGQVYFLRTVEEAADVLFSMHHLARHEYESELVAQLKEPLEKCLAHYRAFFAAILSVLNLQKLSEGIADFTDELTALENQFQTSVPYTLELIDIKRDYVYLAEYIQGLKDLRAILLRLLQALR